MNQLPVVKYICFNSKLIDLIDKSSSISARELHSYKISKFFVCFDFFLFHNPICTPCYSKRVAGCLREEEQLCTKLFFF